MEDHWNKELKDTVLNNRPDLIKLVIERGANQTGSVLGAWGKLSSSRVLSMGASMQ